MRAFAKGGALGAAIVCVVLAATAAIAASVPSSSFLLLPAPAQPLASVVHVQGSPVASSPNGPGIFFVAVQERRASTLETWIGSDQNGAMLVPQNQVIPPGTTQQDLRFTGQADMTDSQRTAAAVAERAVGATVRIGGGARVDAVGMPGGSPAQAAGIGAGDVITAINHQPVLNMAGLRRAMQRVTPGAVVAVTVERGGAALTLMVRTRTLPGRHTAGLGVLVADNIQLPVPVSFAIGDVEGPSAGLAFALQIYAALTHSSIIQGHRVAATGELAADGSVGVIGAVTQKTIGAAQAHVDVFLVPLGNLAEARQAAPATLRVFGVASFADALRVLRGLPRR